MAALARWSGPEVWTGAELADDPDWAVSLSAGEVAELEEAVAATMRAGLPIERVTREDFPLPGLGPRVDGLLAEIVDGRGFVLIRGLPVETWSREQSVRAYWGIGCRLGEAVSQNAMGHLVGHVRDLRAPDRPERRLYQTSRPLPFHSDSCDIVGLLCLSAGKAGGESLIASAAAVHNHLLDTDPEALAVLCGTFHCDRYGEIPAGKTASYPVSIFNRMGRYLTCCGMDPDIRSAQRLPEVPRLTAAQHAALDAMQAAAGRLSLAMTLRPGDVQFVHNHTVLHARAAFEDHDEPERRRHLLRLWLSARQGRPLPGFLAERWGTIAVGARRGGIVVPGQRTSVPLAPGAP